MERNVKATAAAVIATMLLFIAPLIMTDAVYASTSIKMNKISEENNQSKNIQNKTDTKEPIANKLFALMSSGGYNIKTNLKSGFTMRSSKKIFDVWARNGGTKIAASATLFRVGTDGSLKKVEEINIAWDDGNKASFILDMSNQASGDFRIKIWAGGSSLETAKKIVEKDFEYTKVPVGGYIGDITIDIEAFTISLGYIEEPIQFPVYEGENAAQVLDRYLKENGYTYTNTGSLMSSFYLGSIKGIKTDLSKAELESTVATKVDEDNYGWNKSDYTDGSLSEFDFTGYSGWMYSVNNVFPNVGFSEFYLDAGDVLRVQFTVALGREIGGSGSTGGWNPDFYAVADKSESTAILADINSALNSNLIKEDNTAARLIEQVMNVNQCIGASQDEVDEACDQLNAYIDKNDVPIDISLNAAETVIRKNRTQKLEVDYGEIQTLKPLHMKWVSEEDLIATVDSEGNVTGHRAGATVVSVHLGESVAICQVTIEEVPLKKIKLVPVTLWSGGEDPYEQYKTEDGYRLPTDIHPEFMIEPVPEDTTDDITPKYSTDTKKYMDILVLQDSLNRCSAVGKHSGTTVLTAQVGNYSAQLEIEFYENKVQNFTLDSSEFVKDGEIVLNINGEDDLKNALLYFTPDPIPAQDYKSYTFASSDPGVFTVSSYTVYSNSLSARIYPHKDGVAELFVTIGNITKTYPVVVNDMKESDEIVPYGYGELSQTYAASEIDKQTSGIGGFRYRSGMEYRGTKDAKKFMISLTDPSTVLSFQGETYTSHDFVCSGTFQDIYAITYIWPFPRLTGSTGTATFVNKMFGNERMITKISVVDTLIPVDEVKLKAGGNVLGDIGQYSIGDTINLNCDITPDNATGELVWYSSDLSVATVDQQGHVEIIGSGEADIVACMSGVYAVHKVQVDQPMTGMTISNPTLDLMSGMKRQLKAWCVPNDTTDDKTITWESSAPEMVSVSEKGEIRTLHETNGEPVRITAKAGNFNITCEVTVDDHKLRQLYFPKSPVYIEVGETVSLGTPNTVPENAAADAGEYIWTSSDESYASVDQEGNVTLHKASPSDKTGVNLTDEEYNHKVKIFAEKDGIKGSCVIETGSPLTGLDMSSKEVTIYKGDEIELEALFLPDDTTIDRRGVTWTSSNELTVSQRAPLNGAAYKRLIVGRKLGEADITAHCGEFSVSCRVKVVLPEDQQAAYDLQKKIEGWTGLDPVADRADYVRIGLEIQETWETFTDAQKKLVGGYNEYFAEHLDEIREMAASDERVDAVVSLIDSIGEVTLSDESQAKITSAREAYNALTDDEKARFDAEVLKTLTDAETRLAELRDEADRKAREANALQLKIETWAQLDPVLNRTEYISTGLEIQDTWESFADDQKELVLGYNTLFAPHLEEIREMAASDQRVADVVSLIGSIGEVTLDDTSQAKINAAREGFDALTDEEKARVGVDTLKVLTDAEKKISELKEEENRKTQAALDLQDKIEQWTALDPITDRDEYVKTGLEIQDTWESFTDAQKALVPGYEASFAPHLEEIKKMAESDKKVADVISLIDSIGNITLDDACKARIDAARKAYEALSNEQKEKVGLGKRQVLIDAELRIKELQDEADKQETIRKKNAAAKKLKVKGLKVKVKSRKFTLTWKKTKGASGYQVQYRKKGAKKFSSLKTTKLKVRTKKLKKNKKYQFRVRTYVKIEGKPVYGKWTRIKTVKCK